MRCVLCWSGAASAWLLALLLDLRCGSPLAPACGGFWLGALASGLIGLAHELGKEKPP